MKKALLISIAMLAILAVSMVPSAFSFCIPPNPAADDGRWELFGPHVTGIKINVYSGTDTMFTSMDVGQLDVEDWALDTAHALAWSTTAGPITEQNYGGENGYFLVDINNNATYERNGVYVHNPTSDLALRRAIAAMTNRSHMVDFTGGLAQAIYTPVPSYMGGFINPSVPTYGGYYGNLTLANQILDNAGYTIVGGWRIDPHTGQKMTLEFWSRGGDRLELGNDLNANLHLCHIDTDYHAGVAIALVRGPVMANETFNLYTAGWTGIGPDPDYLSDLYNGSNYWHPGSPPNYDNVNYPETNANLTTVKLAANLAQGTAAALDAQYWIAYYAALVPVWSYSGVKAYKNVPVETSTSMVPVTADPTGIWKHLVNQMGFGVNSWWSFLDMQTYGSIYPGINVRYGWSGQAASQNVVYSQWYWDWEELNKIYDGGWGRDPYTLLWGVPQLFKAYSIGSWVDPVTHETKSYVNITLRCGVYWQDGQPVTLADVYYTLVECSKDLLAKGLPPPWWYPTVQYMRSVEIIDDYNMQILLDVQSAWAGGWVIGSTIIPKHIWKPIVDASTVVNNIVNGNTPDPNIIGTGPFKWFSGTGFNTADVVVFVANVAGAQDTYHNTTSPGYFFYEPIELDVNPPNNLVKVNVGFNDASVTIPVDIVLKNLWRDGYLIVNKYVYFGRNLTEVNGEYPSTLLPGYPIDVNLTTVDPYPLGLGHVETITVTMNKKQCPYYLKVAIHIKGPATITYDEIYNVTSHEQFDTSMTWTFSPNTDITFVNGYDQYLPGQTIKYTGAFFFDKAKMKNGPKETGTYVELLDSNNSGIYTIPNPWLSHWINQTIPLFITIKQDISGTTWYDVMGFGSYPAYIKNELPAPDQKCDIKDIAAAAKAFGAIPGSTNWNAVADVNGDYKIDIKDIANIAKQFGY